MAIKIGITGGIGSGKSVVSHLLRLLDIPVYDCDSRSKILLNTDAELKEALCTAVGPNLYTENGLDKTILAAYIFGNPQHLDKVNSIVHPAVKRDFYHWVSQIQSEKSLVGLESAILIDAGFSDAVDILVNVTAPVELRIQRAVARDHSSAELIRKRIASQISDEERCRQADYIIYNDDVRPIIPQLHQLL